MDRFDSEEVGRLEKGVRKHNLISLERITLEKSLSLSFLATNNEAEYENLQVGLITVKKLGGKFVKVHCDSRLVAGQVRGEFEAKDVRMQWYLN